MSGNKKQIVIVDDHPIVRQGFSQLINQENDLHVCGEAENAVEAIQIIQEKNPDLALIDISLKSSNGIELIKDLQKLQPETPILVVSLHDEMVYAERALYAGAQGFIMKAEGTELIMHAIRTVLKGQVYLSDKMKTKVLTKMAKGRPVRHSSPLEILSDRELEVFQLTGEGLGTREIADKLNLGIKTIETHKAHIKEKLKLKNSNELIQFAVKWIMSEQK